MSRTKQHGFTLLEVAVCLLILGLLTGSAALSLRSIKKNVDFETWLDQLITFDRQTRQRAEHQGRPWQILINIDKEMLQSRPVDPSNDRLSASFDHFTAPTNSGTVIEMPQGWKLLNAITDDEEQGTGTSGQLPVRVSTRGLSPTYVLHLTNELNQTRWLLASGGSGRWLESDDETTIDDIFAALRDASGHDAD